MKKILLIIFGSILFTTGQSQNRGIVLDGVDDYVDFGGGFTAGNIRTMECWVKFNDLAGTQEIISKSIVNQGIEMLLFNNTLSVYCMFNASNVSFVSYPASNFATGVWYHLAFTWSNTRATMQLYVNGRPVGTRTDAAGNIDITGIANPGTLRVGAWSDPSPRPFNGSIDEVRLWNTTRTANELKAGMYGTVATDAAGLLAYYKFNEGSGTSTTNNSTSAAVIASSGGTLSNGAAWLAASPVQYAENGIHFDGVNDYITAPANTNYDFSTGTIECWVRTESLSGNACIIGARADPAVRYSFHISSSAIGLWNGSTYLTVPYTVSPGQWYHLAFVCTPTATTVFVNGASIGSTGNVIGGTTGLPLNIGVANPAASFEQFSGSIDEVRIWNVARTQAQIAANMNISLTGAESNLVGLFSFNQGIPGGANTGLVTAIDATSNNNHGTLVNFGLTGSASNWVDHLTASANPAPIVTSFSPTTGKVGSTVVISGNNFNTTPANNIVYFGNTRATVTASSTTSITATVPAGASYQPITVLNTAYALIGASVNGFDVQYSGSALTYSAKTDGATTGAPTSVATGDLDGDGKSDIVYTSDLGGNITTLRNTSTSGIISFAPAEITPTGANAFGVTLADVDGDGKKDVLVANSGSNTVSVLRNTSTVGSISFSAATTLTTNSGPRGITVGDLDNDGRPEVIATTTNSFTVDIFRNTSSNGAISFAARQNLSANNPEAVTAADFDGDGKLDLAATTGNANGVSIFLNTSVLGTVSFAAAANLNAGSYTLSLVATDIDRDGKPDISVVNRDGSTISVMRNTSTAGSISFAAQQAISVGTSPYWIVSNDMDGDGKPDLAVTNANSNTVSVLLNKSTPGTLSIDPALNFATANFPRSLIAADLDNDTKPDIMTVNQSSANYSILRNSQTLLPISGLTFAALKKSAAISLNWSTLTENNSDYFDVEKSTDGVQFRVIGTVRASGSSSQKSNYSFEDLRPSAGLNYYRLNQIDRDGKAKQSGIIQLFWQDEKNLTITLAPQPVITVMNVRISGNLEKGRFLIYNNMGRLVKRYPVSAGSSSFQVDRAGLTSGVYFYKLVNEAGAIRASGRMVAQ